MSASAASITTAGIRPELFPEQLVRTKSRALLVSTLALVIVLGFGLRAFQLSAEGLSEDELNKVRAVEDYRRRGLSSANGEHPLLMKGLLIVSLALAEGWNATSLARTHDSLQVPVETAVRLPAAIFGALTSLLIFLVAAELFGPSVGLVAAALWAFDPAAIGFNRIAKEDSFLLFFFLLANIFWLRGQRVAEEGRRSPDRYYWGAAAGFGAMLASKYMPHLFGISVSYYWIFQGVKAARWRLGKRRWLIFFVVMGAAFLACNPTILLPDTWREMRIFAGEHRIGHDSYEFMGQLYRNQMTLWLKGSPWYFYYVFMGVKLPLATLAAFLVGLPVLFTRRLGDGRFFVLFWIFFWFFPFTVLGGKFTRYFTFALPVVLITAAIGINAVSQKLSGLFARRDAGDALRFAARAGVACAVVALAAYASASAAPNFRLYTNALGGGTARAGTYFPHDEFYDSSMRATVQAFLPQARRGARVASETPEVVNFYARSAGRDDLDCISLSDAAALGAIEAGDVVVVARGRRYFSNEKTVAQLRGASQAAQSVSLGRVPAAEIFVLDESSAAAVRRAVGQ
ncbi:MAG TPA: glycosyltransferase family 39 protein [Pyrinomonadaceae bacterium]|nr:glycosyltransferase family 39 protein [Pyrinomonadaceae bacterium]